MPKVSSKAGETRLGQLLGAGEHQPQRAELRRGAAPQVELEERRRGQQDRRRGSARTSSPTVAGVERVGMADQPHARGWPRARASM